MTLHLRERAQQMCFWCIKALSVLCSDCLKLFSCTYEVNFWFSTCDMCCERWYMSFFWQICNFRLRPLELQICNLLKHKWNYILIHTWFRPIQADFSPFYTWFSPDLSLLLAYGKPDDNKDLCYMIVMVILTSNTQLCFEVGPMYMFNVDLT